MAKGKGGGAKPAAKEASTRNNGKASKKRPKKFDAIKRRLVTEQCYNLNTQFNSDKHGDDWIRQWS